MLNALCPLGKKNRGPAMLDYTLYSKSSDVLATVAAKILHVCSMHQLTSIPMCFACGRTMQHPTDCVHYFKLICLRFIDT